MQTVGLEDGGAVGGEGGADGGATAGSVGLVKGVVEVSTELVVVVVFPFEAISVEVSVEEI